MKNLEFTPEYLYVRGKKSEGGAYIAQITDFDKKYEYNRYFLGEKSIEDGVVIIRVERYKDKPGTLVKEGVFEVNIEGRKSFQYHKKGEGLKKISKEELNAWLSKDISERINRNRNKTN